DAYARGEDGVHEPCRVAEQDQAIGGELAHRVAVVALVLELTDAFGLLQRLAELRSTAHGVPEELLARLLALGEVLLLRDHADAGGGIADRDLPDPRV